MPDLLIRIGTRGSKLALAQTQIVIDYLRRQAADGRYQIIEIKTSGDTDKHTALPEIGGQGIFTKKIEQELLKGNIDLAVHSAKDLPSVMTKGLAIGAVLQRESPEDVWISGKGYRFDEFPKGGIVGTSSPRRKALLLNRRPDLCIKDIRGNLETRLRKLADDEYEAIVVARAGLKRLGLDDIDMQILPVDDFIPAAGQGFLVVQIREGDKSSAALVSGIDNKSARRCLEIERKVLEKLNAGCSTPIGCLARINSGGVHVSTCVLDRKGKKRLNADGKIDISEANEVMIDDIISSLLSQGARELIRTTHED